MRLLVIANPVQGEQGVCVEVSVDVDKNACSGMQSRRLNSAPRCERARHVREEERVLWLALNRSWHAAAHA